MSNPKQTIKHLTIAIGTVLLLAVVVLWSWNTLAGALVPLSKLNYIQALALVLLLGSAGFLLHWPGRRHVGRE